MQSNIPGYPGAVTDKINDETLEALVPTMPVVPQQAIFNSQFTTIFVGSIPLGIDDDHIQSVLQCFGPVLSWKRYKDASGKLKAFGFCEYAHPDSVLRSLVILGTHERHNYYIPSLDPTGKAKKLVLQADDQTKKFLENYIRNKPPNPNEEELTQIAINRLEGVIQNLRNTREALMNGEIKDGRNISERERREWLELKRKKQNSSYISDTENNGESSSSEEEEYKRELRRRERRRKEKEQKYKDELIKWERDEIQRIKIHEKDKIREKETVKEKETQVRKLKQMLEEFDDDDKYNQHDFYKDKKRWLEKRERQLEREKQQKEIDFKYLENERKAKDAKEKVKEKYDTKKHSSRKPEFQNDKNNNSDKNNQKLKLNIKNKGQNEGIRAEDRSSNRTNKGIKLDEEENDNNQNKKKFIPVPNEKDKYYKERMKIQLQTLAESIPNDQEKLFKWNIMWEYLDDTILEKIERFANKKILQYLEIEEPELTKFILNHIKDRKKPDDLTKELEKTLDEDGPQFALMLWRLLIFETESKSLNLKH